MDMQTIVRQQAEFVRNSVASIEVDRALSTVYIRWSEGNGAEDEDVFLQGHEAEEFIAEANTLYQDESLNLTLDDANHITAYKYAS